MNVASHQAYTIPDVDSMTDDIESPLHLPSLEDKAILVDFDGGRLSSAVYLRYADKYLGPLASRQNNVHQPVIMSPKRFSTPHPHLLDDI